MPHLNARLLVLFVDYLNWETDPQQLISLEDRIKEQHSQLGEAADIFHEDTASLLLGVFRDRLLQPPPIPQAPPIPQQAPTPPPPLPRISPVSKPRYRLSVKEIDFDILYGSTSSPSPPEESDEWSDQEDQNEVSTPLIAALETPSTRSWGFEEAKSRSQCLSFAMYLASDPTALAALVIVEPDSSTAGNFFVIAFAAFNEDYTCSVIDRLYQCLTPIAQSRLPPSAPSDRTAAFEFEITFVFPESAHEVIRSTLSNMGFALMAVTSTSSSSHPTPAIRYRKQIKTTRQHISHLSQLVHNRLLMRRSSLDPDH